MSFDQSDSWGAIYCWGEAAEEFYMLQPPLSLIACGTLISAVQASCNLLPKH